MNFEWKEEELAEAERVLGHTFSDRGLLKTCFTHASLTNAGYTSNERLEFLGDAVLELLVTEKLYRSIDAREGTLTELRKRYVSKSALERAERRIGLMRFLRYAGGEDTIRGKTASNLFEAALGAIYLDGGMAAAKTFLMRTLEAIDPDNFKSVLQEFVQKSEHAPPVYETVADGDGYRSVVRARGQEACGTGTSKKAAETAAAKNLYGILSKQ